MEQWSFPGHAQTLEVMRTKALHEQNLFSKVVIGSW
jgi:hypothetical protein